MITQERLKELLEYNPETGQFTNKILRGRLKVGAFAGTLRSDGYIQIRLDKKAYYAQQLAFLFMTGIIPEEVDHINRIRSDNRWVNLRESNRQENSRNRKSTSNSGYLGVSWNTKAQKWQVMVRNSTGNNIFGGYFNYEDLDYAVAKANGLRLELHGTLAVIEEFKGFPQE
ncbi:homing endonuclease [Salmonella phage smaug]|uniref:Homing endonuclease n=2 Tax=Epseptimavirus TaxID=2732017 RepID=A0A6G8RCV2_9CAUD|nr:homing endonuclease [Salmonella phage phagemcphageface]QIO01052.1 homing endonuclease [Salmonella phage smaug]